MAYPGTDQSWLLGTFSILAADSRSVDSLLEGCVIAKRSSNIIWRRIINSGGDFDLHGCEIYLVYI